jgi:signal transduction histidine kinase
MKLKIPWKVLALSWVICLIYIPALQFSARDIAYFVHYENMYLLAFLCSAFLSLHFYNTRDTLHYGKISKCFSYCLLLLAYPTIFILAKIVWPFSYTPESTPANKFLIYFLFLFLVICFAIGGEIFFFFLSKWNTLRRRSMTLNLTQILSLIVLALPMLMVMGFIILNAITTRGETNTSFTQPVTFLGKFFTTVATQLFPFTGISAGVGVLAVVMALPFVFFLSWGIAKHYTRRLKYLVESVKQMKTGDLQTRVVIDGEDEISRLSTDFNEMAEALEFSQKELLQKQEKISALLASQKEWLLKISHELRTPITTLKAVLESTPPENVEEINKRTIILQQEVDGLHRLIEDLFALTQSEHAQLSLQMESIHVPDDLAPLLSPLRTYAWEEKRIEMIINFDLAALIIQVDRMRLSQVLHNLIHNAVRYTPLGGVISIRGSRMADQFILTIKDTGEGIPADLIEKVWDPFQKHPRSSGAGIGLTLSKELVLSMGGTIAIKSEPNCGACFEIQFPIQ